MPTTKMVPCGPALRSIIGVEVMPISGDSDVRQIERLPIYSSVHWNSHQQTELGRIHICRRENAFVCIQAGPRDVVVVGYDVDARSCCGGIHGHGHGGGV